MFLHGPGWWRGQLGPPSRGRVGTLCSHAITADMLVVGSHRHCWIEGEPFEV